LNMGFDTGSAGLRIFSTNAETGLSNLTSVVYTDTGIKISAPFGGTEAGRTYFGDIAIAAGIKIGGPNTGNIVQIQNPVEFEIVNAVCAGANYGPTPPPTCNSTMVTEQKNFGDGLFGVEPEPATSSHEFYSLMGELPGSLSSGFVVSAYGVFPHVSVGGITQQLINSFSTYQVVVAQEPDGSPYWPGAAGIGLTEYPWCYTIGPPTSAPDCAAGYGTKTDSGGNAGKIYLNATAPPTVPTAELTSLPAGTTVTASLGPIMWTWVTTGNGGYCNDPPFFFSGNDPSLILSYQESNSGISPFYFNDVLYDLKGGHFGFRAPSAAVVPPALCLPPST
jgi:hypothetical protein